MTNATVTLPVTINRETREVEFRIVIDTHDAFFHGVAFAETMGLFTKGAGNKLWPEKLMARRDSKTGEWLVQHATVILNRNGYRLVAFADKVAGHRSEHNSARAD